MIGSPETASMERQDANGPMIAEHPNVAVLRGIYADLTRISEYVDDEVVLHAAERDLPGVVPIYRGARAVLDREIDLIRRMAGTLVMDVGFIGANDHFGAVSGYLRATLEGESIALPFCGVWRFCDGRIVEHWENAYSAAKLAEFLARHPVS